MKKIICIVFFISSLFSCKKEVISVPKKEIIKPKKKTKKPLVVYKYGYKLDNFKVIKGTIKTDETFGLLLDRNHIYPKKVSKIAKKVKPVFDVRKIRVGKPYIILASNDSIEKAQVFIYEYNKQNATIIDFRDSLITAYHCKKPTKIVEKKITGIIQSNFSVAMDNLHILPELTYKIADIYAWTLDFYKLQKGDLFKIIYQEKFVNDSIFVGYGKVISAVFKHKKKDLYAYRYVADSIKKIPEYYDEKGNTLRRKFLKSPIKFRYRISSRYNLRRRISYYGNRIRPHKGTDFAARIGTPIIATASGTVIASTRKRANGNYVKIRHNNKYSTQYLHMKRRKVRKGQYVKQGQVIGWVGMTGNTSGPHVCYRFWKYGKQVNPFRQKLPAAKPLKRKVKQKYLEFIKPLQKELDALPFYQ